MIFQVHKRVRLTTSQCEEPATFSWTLDRQDGTSLIRSARENFQTEEEARSDIAQARKSLKGAAFAKVKSPNGRTS